MSRWTRSQGTSELCEYFDRPEIVKGGWIRLAGKSDELKVVLSEIDKCRNDFTFFARNYAWIQTKDRRRIPFNLWESQDLLLEKVLEIKAKHQAQKVIIMKARQLGFCQAPNTRVLTADLKWITLEEIQPGQEIIAVDESAPGGKGLTRKMRTGSVLAKADVFERAIRLTMDDGRVLMATPDHRYMCKQRGGPMAMWRRVADMQIGDKIKWVTKPWTNAPSYDDGWFAGILDGEGSIRNKPKAGIEICAAQVAGETFEAMKAYLAANGYAYRIEVDRRKAGDSSKFGDQPVYKVVIGRLDEVFRLIGHTRPKRLSRKILDGRWWEGRDLPGKKSGVGYASVVSIEELPKQRMIDLQTTTGTYIAEGFVSHNSTLIEVMMAWRVMFFENVSAIIVSHAPHHSVSLFDKLCLVYDSVPWWMQPMCSSRLINEGLKLDNPNHDERAMYPGLKSSVVVQAANQMTGVGQGYTIHACHCCLAEDTLVRIGSGGVVKISEMTPRDSVLTSSGTISRVRAVARSRRADEGAVSAKLWGCYAPLVTTRDHRYMTASGYREAQDLKPGDMVGYPVRRMVEPCEEVARQGFSVVSQATGGDRSNREKRATSIVFPPSVEWGRFFGLYLAKGTVALNKKLRPEYAPARITFSIHQKEEASVLEMLRAWLPDKEFVPRHLKNSQTVHVDVNHSGLARFVSDNFGRVESKTVPDWAWGSGGDFCRGLVSGYLFGDGHLDRKNRLITASSVRPAISFQMRDLVASLGYGWSTISNRPAGYHYGRNCKEIWMWGLASSVAVGVAGIVPGWSLCPSDRKVNRHWEYSPDGRFVEIEVASVDAVDGTEFYDLEVDAEEHNFTTIQCCVANSEIADWEDGAAKQILEGDLQYALAEGPETFAFLETTAKGSGRYFAKFWDKAVELGEKSEWYPFFVPWFFEKGRKLFPMPTSYRIEEPEEQIRASVLMQWLRCDSPSCGRFRETVERGGRNLTGTTCPTCEVGIMQPHRLGDDQLLWMANKRLNAAKDLESLKEYHQELPTTPSEAFQISGVQVFPHEAFEWVRHTVESCQPHARGFMDNNGAFHGVRASDGRCPEEGCDVDHQYDDLPLTVWNEPEKDGVYTIGVDVSEGLGGEGDYSVAAVNKVSQFHEADEIVAVYRSNTIDPLSFAFPIAFMGKWYNEALVSIEVNKYDTTFTWVRNQLQYPNNYRWKHVDSTNPHSNKWGWETNLKSRPRLYQTAIKFLKSHMWIIKSKNCYREMQHFQKEDYEDRRVEHSLGEYDDELMASMISLYCSHDQDYDDNLGFIPIRRSAQGLNTFSWVMNCRKCSNIWGSNDPNQESQCPRCYSLHIRGDKQQIINMGTQTEWQELAREQSEGPKGEILEYDYI